MLNLIADPWIPVRRRAGADTVRPDQIADAEVLAFDWPRPDLNLACYELMIGLAYLACPPENEDQRYDPPDQAAFRAALASLAPAFELLGDGPRFLQDYGPFDGEPKSPDMLFIDASGDSTAKKNADLMVKRGRYETLSLPLAAIALYTMQAFAPSGGAGNRTSMRGGGPMVTLVKPEGAGLWGTIWANVPCGDPLPAEQMDALPWMRPTVTSEKGQVVTPTESFGDDAPDPEMFFGQPRRLRLVDEGDKITGVLQRPYGTNYAAWVHDLSPYYEDPKGQILPVHPKPGPFGYRNWRGVILQQDKRRRPACLERLLGRAASRLTLIVAGWAMDNMKPLDFIWSEQPVFDLSGDAEAAVFAMVEAAEQASFALAATVKNGVGEDALSAAAAGAARQAFFTGTEPLFLRRVEAISAGDAPDQKGWLRDMRDVAVPLFDAKVLPGLDSLQASRREKAVQARRSLLGAFGGNGPLSKKIFQALSLEGPPQCKPRKKEAAR
ncbi:MAG: type I-E CRISPR-associated protein Cse1/CasA [Pseudomonadota bacterium]